MESYKIPFGWKAALEQEEFGVCAHSSCWVQGGNVGCNSGKNIDIAADVIHPVSTVGVGEPPVTTQRQRCWAQEPSLGSP